MTVGSLGSQLPEAFLLRVDHAAAYGKVFSFVLLPACRR
jgi:hypothetical protein